MSRMNDPQVNDQGEGAEGASATKQMRESASNLGSNLRDVGTHVKEAAVEQYEHLKDTASDYYDAGRDKARQWIDDLEHYVQDQPLKSVMIAAGVGVLLGIIWKKS